jgi:hypothetical protein
MFLTVSAKKYLQQKREYCLRIELQSFEGVWFFVDRYYCKNV